MYVQDVSVSCFSYNNKYLLIITVPVLAISVTFFVRFTVSLNYNLHVKCTYLNEILNVK